MDRRDCRRGIRSRAGSLSMRIFHIDINKLN
jgi:hypothetical protein